MAPSWWPFSATGSSCAVGSPRVRLIHDRGSGARCRSDGGGPGASPAGLIKHVFSDPGSAVAPGSETGGKTGESQAGSAGVC